VQDLMLAMAQQDFADAWRAWPDRRPLARCVALQRAALEARPDDPVALQNLANSLRLAGLHDEAVTVFERALALEPTDAVLRNDHGLALSAVGRADDAVAAYRRALVDDPGFLAARQNLARALWRAGDDAGARSELAAAASAARERGAPWRLYRFLADRAWRTSHRTERR
jgi:tetratricopeptide (TPR) repeat protein